MDNSMIEINTMVETLSPAPVVLQQELPMIDLIKENEGELKKPLSFSKRIAQEYKSKYKIMSYEQRLNFVIEESNKLYKELKIVDCNISSPGDAVNLIEAPMRLLQVEELWTINLNRRNRIISITKVYRGNVSSSQVRIGELFKQPIIEMASAMIIAHNHPSGDPTPSPDDVAITRAIVQAGKLLDIDILDHLIIGGNKWVSLKERGLGFA